MLRDGGMASTHGQSCTLTVFHPTSMVRADMNTVNKWKLSSQ